MPKTNNFLPALLALALVQWTLYFLYLEPEPSTSIMASRKRTAQDQYVRALARCRAEKKFFFRDLPVECRRQIYVHLFSDPAFVVCSFTKDRTLTISDPWPENARAQILCTCKTNFKEAWRYLYSHTDWHFPSASSLIYFTWFDISASKLGLVRSITITGLPALEEGFWRASPRLSGLRTIVVNDGSMMYRQRPLDEHQHENLVRRVMGTPYYTLHVMPHIIAPQECNVYVVVQLVCELENEERTREVVAIDVNCKTIIRNYCTVPEARETDTIELPSANDPDVI